MRKKSLLLALTLVIMSASVMAQSVDDILNKYFETIGGKAKLEALNGVKISAKINQGGMEIPLDIIQLKDGKQVTNINFQGKVIKQGAYDGTTMWSHNFMNMKAEKSDAEATENYYCRPVAWCTEKYRNRALGSDIVRSHDVLLDESSKATVP